jgi:phage recombination protein Bet
MNNSESTQLAVLPQAALARAVDAPLWNALKEMYDAPSDTSLGLVIDYCKARKLDPMKKPVHIVPVWSNRRKCMVETVWPSILEIRTTAMRTGKYAGADETKFGPTQKQDLGDAKEFTYPEWAQKTVYRMMDGNKCAFPGPRVYFLESYATSKRGEYTPNAMWQKRPWGQLEKCAEAAALRGAFPEETGLTAEEMSGRNLEDHEPVNVTGSADAPAAGSEGGEVRRAAVPTGKRKGAAGIAHTVIEPAPETATQTTAAAPAVEVRATEVAVEAELAPAPAPAPVVEAKAEVVAETESAPVSTPAPEAAAPAAEPAAEQAPADPSAEAPKRRGRPPGRKSDAPAAEAPKETQPAGPEWPKVISASVMECVDAPVTGNPKYKSVKVARLTDGVCAINGAEMDVSMLGRVIFDPERPELKNFATVSPEIVQFTIDEQPSASNPQRKNRVIIAASVADVAM